MEDYQQRVTDELNEITDFWTALDERMRKLLAFRATELFKSLPPAERKRLYRQTDAMGKLSEDLDDYSEILRERIANFLDDGE